MLKQEKVDLEFVRNAVCRGCPQPSPLKYTDWLGYFHICTMTVEVLLDQVRPTGPRY